MITLDWKAIGLMLRMKLDPKHVKPAPRGKHGEFVDGYHVITEANRIFGEGGWSYEVTRLEKVSEQIVKTDRGAQFRVGYLCAVRANVGGVIREGLAVGSGVGNPDTLADHHESAVKEAETDALKRALRTFGNTFGLALYDKEKSQVGVDPPKFDPIAARDRIKFKIGRVESAAKLEHVWEEEREDITRLKREDTPKFDEINKAKDVAKERLGVE
ncbi:MAG: RAD52 family DNA repair protein [Paracoccaceae bacterium]|nr:RAD52 family DNA repair protein [Paracoccaceae bacterium]